MVGRTRARSTALEAVGKTIRRFRRRAKLTQEQLAEMAGMEGSQISQIELGRDPLLSTLFRVARALKVPPSLLVGDADKSVVDRVAADFWNLPRADQIRVAREIREAREQADD